MDSDPMLFPTSRQDKSLVRASGIGPPASEESTQCSTVELCAQSLPGWASRPTRKWTGLPGPLVRGPQVVAENGGIGPLTLSSAAVSNRLPHHAAVILQEMPSLRLPRRRHARVWRWGRSPTRAALGPPGGRHTYDTGGVASVPGQLPHHGRYLAPGTGRPPFQRWASMRVPSAWTSRWVFLRLYTAGSLSYRPGYV